MTTIVMTGATSGIGRVAAETLLRDGATMIVGARGGGIPDGAGARQLDLASLASVRGFAAALPERIDGLALNAGTQSLGVAGRTIDVPATFISGASDWGIHQVPGAIEKMQRSACTRMDRIHLIPGAGHWVQQEQPAEVSRLLVGFLGPP